MDTSIKEDPKEIVKRFDDAINKYIELGKKRAAENEAAKVQTEETKPTDIKEAAVTPPSPQVIEEPKKPEVSPVVDEPYKSEV